MNSSVAIPTPARKLDRGASKTALALACCMLAAACSTQGGKRIAQGGGYRTGAIGTALSNAANRSPGEVARVQERLRRSGQAARSSGRAGSAESASAARGRAAAPRRTASAPVPDPLESLRAEAEAQRSGLAAAEPRPQLQRIAYDSRDLAGRALTNQSILAPALSPMTAAPARAVASRPAAVNRALADWSLSRSQWGVLGFGLFLSVLAALIAAWSTARRRRALAEPRIAEPVAANDLGPLDSATARARPAGPQYLLPLSPAAAQPRSYSLKAGGTAKLTSPRR